MGKEKDSFIVYYDWEEALSDLSNEQLGEFLRAVFAYEKHGVLYDGQDNAVKMAMRFVRGTLDRNREKYKETCERNRRNGAKGGAPVGNQNARKQPKQPSGIINNPKQPKQPEHEHEHEHEPERDREQEPEHEREPDASGGGSGLFPFAHDDVEKVVNELTGAGIPVDEAAKKLLGEWMQRYDFGFVDMAVWEAINRKARKFRYLEGIVRNWGNAGITTGDKAVEYLIKTGELPEP